MPQANQLRACNILQSIAGQGVNDYYPNDPWQKAAGQRNLNSWYNITAHMQSLVTGEITSTVSVSANS